MSDPGGSTRPVPVAEAVALEKHYPFSGETRIALAGVSLAILPGRFVSVMGPSGSGKSTLLHLMAGLDRPTAGVVMLDGRRLDTMAEGARILLRRQLIGVIFQSYNLVPVLSVAENVALPLLIAGQRGADVATAVADALALTGLDSRGHQLPAELSGGEQQRTAIARAIVTRPRLLLADEPTGNLDSATGSRVLKILLDLQQELGHSVLLVTHDPKVAACGDEVVHLRDGIVTGHLDLRRGRPRRPVDRIIAWLTEGEV